MKFSKADAPLGFFSHSTSLNWDRNELHKTPTGQINLFLFLRLPSETLIQMHAVALQFNNYPDSHRAVSRLVLFPLNQVSLAFACAVCQSSSWYLLFHSCNLPHHLLWFFSVLLCGLWFPHCCSRFLLRLFILFIYCLWLLQITVV